MTVRFVNRPEKELEAVKLVEETVPSPEAPPISPPIHRNANADQENSDKFKLRTNNGDYFKDSKTNEVVIFSSKKSAKKMRNYLNSKGGNWWPERCSWSKEKPTQEEKSLLDSALQLFNLD